MNIPYRITHKQGRNRTGSDLTGKITHAVIEFNAICGDNPGKTSGGWSDYNDKILTCKKCLKIINQKSE